MNAGEMSEWRFGESCFCSPTSAESAKTRKTKHTSLSYSYIEKNITYTTDLVRVVKWADCVVFYSQRSWRWVRKLFFAKTRLLLNRV